MCRGAWFCPTSIVPWTRHAAVQADAHGGLARFGFADEIEGATQRMIEELPDNLGHLDSESTLEDWGKAIETLAARFDADPRVVERAPCRSQAPNFTIA